MGAQESHAVPSSGSRYAEVGKDGAQLVMDNNCDCWFCREGKQHAPTHKNWFDLSPTPKFPGAHKAEDLVYWEACVTCGHVQKKEG